MLIHASQIEHDLFANNILFNIQYDQVHLPKEVQLVSAN